MVPGSFTIFCYNTTSYICSVFLSNSIKYIVLQCAFAWGLFVGAHDINILSYNIFIF